MLCRTAVSATVVRCRQSKVSDLVEQDFPLQEGRERVVDIDDPIGHHGAPELVDIPARGRRDDDRHATDPTRDGVR